MMLNRSLVLFAAVVIAAALAGVLPVSAQSGLTNEKRAIRHISARLLDEAGALERDWRALKADIDPMEQRKDLVGLGCVFLGRNCPGNGSPSRLIENLRSTVSANAPCEGLDIKDCLPEDLFKTVLQVGLTDAASKMPYLKCISGHHEWAVLQKAKEFRERSGKVAKLSTLNQAIREVQAAAQGEIQQTDRTRSCLPQGGRDPRAIPSFEVSVEWGATCDSGNRLREDGSAELYHPTVGALVTPSRRLGSQAFCTGTLIAPNAVLTAAHCFYQTGARGDPGSPFFPTYSSCRRGTFFREGRPFSPIDPKLVSVFFQHAGEFKAQEILIHPDFRWLGILPRADLAIVLLDRSVPGIEPAVIDTVRIQRYATTGISVGFGFATTIDAEGRPANNNSIVERTGVKFAARIAPSPCLYSERARRLICWDRRAEFWGTRLGSTCNGDSGGPLFMDVNGKTYLAGVTSAGSPGCALGTRAYDIEVFAFRKWIAEVLRDEPAPPPEVSLKNGRQRKCRYYGLGNMGTETIKIERSRDRRLRVSLNCQSIGRPIKLTLRREEQEQDLEVVNCGESTAMGLSCAVPVRHQQEWKIDYDGGNSPGCQIVATTFE